MEDGMIRAGVNDRLVRHPGFAYLTTIIRR
jgi:hypothetical protein